MLLNIFKSKPTLKDLIPNDYVDIHSHILPGLDDGCKNINESEEITNKLKELAFNKLIFTPHIINGLYNNDLISIKTCFEKFNKNNPSKLSLDYACEYMIDESLIEKADNKKLITIGDKYVLLEMSYLSEPINLNEILFQIQTNGYIPIIAHPERYRFWFEKFKKFIKLKDRGCLFQLNLLSSIGYYGKDIAKFCDKLLKNNMIDFTGTDIHNINQSNLFLDINDISAKTVIKEHKKLKSLMSNNSIFL
tara:strand:+ start:335 stop:1081 length:747 start_codon:yes stop_codon:yes gene_type:complete